MHAGEGSGSLRDQPALDNDRVAYGRGLDTELSLTAELERVKRPDCGLTVAAGQEISSSQLLWQSNDAEWASPVP